MQMNLSRIERLYYTGAIDGIFGKLTLKAVKSFQTDHYLVVDGIWGEKTNAASLAATKKIQTLLNSVGYNLDVDGIAGSLTFAAIKDFQKNNGLDVDGIAGRQTIAKLNALISQPSSGKRIMLDPGHGGSDPGASGNGFAEKDLNLSIANYCKAYLEGAGFTVAMTRNADNYISLMNRCYAANNFGADVFVSVHNNAGGGDGSEFIYYPTSANGKKLCDAIKPHVDALGQNFRRYIARDDAVVTYTKMPACIVECAFIDNAADIQIVATDEKRKAMGEAIAKGVGDYFN
jgi:N-acetylmuramoyl-L-alanine amidase